MMMKFSAALGGAALAVAAIGMATPAAAQMFLTAPDFKPGPIEGSDPLVGIALPGATPTEARAHLIWNLRSGLNVAALQCQFSPYLRAVDNYNGFLAHHSGELANAYSALSGYFKRVHGREGMKRFDDYSTSTYNGFSTLHAQYGFCQVAADIAKGALTRPKGELHLYAGQRVRELRNSLVPVPNTIANYNPYAIRLPQVPPLNEDCYDRKNRLKRKCATAFTQLAN